MSDLLLSFLSDHGVAVLVLVLFGATCALPLPASLLLIAAGALVAEGHLSYPVVVTAGIAAAVLGDHTAYLLGRHLRGWAERIGTARQRLRAETFVRRWGGWGVFLSRWLVAPLGPVVNYAAGASRLRLARFTPADVAGEIVWVAGYVGLGVTFSAHIDRAVRIVTDVSWSAAAVFALVVVLLYRRHTARAALPKHV